MTQKAKLRPRERDTIVQALRAGVVPRVGLAHVQVGRVREIEELVKDIERIADGGAAIRFIIGEYGSGKTFFMNLIRQVALEKGLVAMFADLAPDRRIHATAGQARGLYAEMTRNLATRSKPEGGALSSLVERFAANAQREAATQDQSVDEVIGNTLRHFEEMTGGFEFAEVIRRYWQGHETGDDELKSSALRWLRGEFATKTDARKALGVRTIISDASVYDHLKLMSAFAVQAGYKGLLVGMDEMVNLYKLTSSQARSANYEQILRILNDVLQGSAEHLGFLMGGTPDFLMDTRRGLYSYEALQSRLALNSFAVDGMVDLTGPVVRLANLTPEDMFVLLSNVRSIMLEDISALPDDALQAFMTHCSQRIGEAYFRTPRNTVTAFVNMLAILQQYPERSWDDLVDKVDVAEDAGDDLSDIEETMTLMPAEPSDLPEGDESDEDDDALTSFKL